MVSRLAFDLSSRGSLMRINDLVTLGHSRSEIVAAITRGEIVRVCNGWVATLQADRDAILAIASGGKLTSSSALSSRGIWDGCDRRIHIAIPPNTPRKFRVLRTPVQSFRPMQHPRVGLVRHWTSERAPDGREPTWRVSVIDALAASSRHLSADQFIACVDSALHTNQMSPAGLPILRAALSARTRPLLDLIDVRAESGLESLARVRLARVFSNIQVQFPIAGIAATSGVGRVDLLLDGWLALELDGDEWHDPKRDRSRDAVLVRQGFRCQRFGYEQVLNEWPETEATVFELLRYPPPPRKR
jgi:hypothetical protein